MRERSDHQAMKWDPSIGRRSWLQRERWGQLHKFGRRENWLESDFDAEWHRKSLLDDLRREG